MIQVDPEFAALCPPLTAEEYSSLEASLLAEGCRDALVIWAETGILLDGHNRKWICEIHGIPYQTREIVFPDRDSAMRWIITNQLARRNLTPDAASLLRGRLYNLQKREVGRPEKLDQNDPISFASTAERLAGELGVSAPTIKRDGQFAAAVETIAPFVPDIAPRVMMGDIPSRKAVIDAAKQPETAARYFKPENIHVSDDSYEWFTPREIIESARIVMGGIDTDPASCAEANRVVRARQYYTLKDDGLTQPWIGNVWLNPPYNMPWIQAFVLKAVSEYLADRERSVMVLTNNSTDASWFHAILLHATVCLTKGRLRFWSRENKTLAARQGQAIFYLGRDRARFASEFGQYGAILEVISDNSQF